MNLPPTFTKGGWLWKTRFVLFAYPPPCANFFGVVCKMLGEESAEGATPPEADAAGPHATEAEPRRRRVAGAGALPRRHGGEKSGGLASSEASSELTPSSLRGLNRNRLPISCA